MAGSRRNQLRDWDQANLGTSAGNVSVTACNGTLNRTGAFHGLALHWKREDKTDEEEHLHGVRVSTTYDCDKRYRKPAHALLD
jgi:hypothetical protein